MVDARSENAVRLLRERKHREEKPFALMFPSIESIKAPVGFTARRKAAASPELQLFF